MAEIFDAIRNPDDTVLNALSQIAPENPFLSRQFVAYRSMLGSDTIPWALGLSRDSRLICGCIAYLSRTRGPWSNRLEIHSLLHIPAGLKDLFWTGLWAFCKEQRVSALTVQTFGSRSPMSLPGYPAQLWHRQRCEYVLNLDKFAGRKSLSSNHRRNINRAERGGIQFAEADDQEAAAHVHADLIDLSMQRRQERGEVVGNGDSLAPTARLVSSGAARIFQARLGGEVLSSILILSARAGAYYHSAGTSPEGMKAGASHYLIMQLATNFKQQGLSTFNLGGTDSEGLARFKAGFGATPVELESASYHVGGPLSRSVDVLLAGLRRFRA